MVFNSQIILIVVRILYINPLQSCQSRPHLVISLSISQVSYQLIMKHESRDQQTKDTEIGLPLGTLSEADIERLGRQRPNAFPTAFTEIGFCFSLLASMFMAVGYFCLNISQC